MAPSTAFPAAALVLSSLRGTRFRHGIVCPRCGRDDIVRWGRQRQRQRYRCRNCRRTFSDLTGTPAAYSKHLSRWPAFGACMLESLSVRGTADRLGVSPKTAFRWRHRVLEALRLEAGPALRGAIGISQSKFAFSEKGSRKLTRPPRRHGSRFRWPQPPPVFVVRAADRHGAVWAEVLVGRWPRSLDLVPLIRDRVAPPALLVASFGLASSYAAAARRLRCPYRSTRSLRGDGAASDPDVARARAIDRAFHVWLIRFRGVATRYLRNYLCWHRVVDLGDRATPLAGLLGWKAGSDDGPLFGGRTRGARRRAEPRGWRMPPPPCQHFPTTEPEGSCRTPPPRRGKTHGPRVSGALRARRGAHSRGPPRATRGYARA